MYNTKGSWIMKRTILDKLLFISKNYTKNIKWVDIQINKLIGYFIHSYGLPVGIQIKKIKRRQVILEHIIHHDKK